MNKNILAIAVGAVLLGGVAVAAIQVNGRDGDAVQEQAPRLEYAEVVDVVPLTEARDLYATVIGSEPVRETTTSSTPRQVCEDVVVQQQAPVRDPNRVAGTTIGAVVGGALGNQVGGGDGRRLATVGGAVGGAFAGRAIQERQQQNNVQLVTERQCHTVQDSSQSSRTVAYNVTYRNPDGTTGTMRTGSQPGERIKLGTEQVPVAYDVTYSYAGQERSIRLEQLPADDRLPVVDGQLVVQTTALDAGGDAVIHQ